MIGTCVVCGDENVELNEEGKCAKHNAEGGAGDTAAPAEGMDTGSGDSAM